MTSKLAPVLFWWEARAWRERLLLALLMVVIATWLAFAVILQPLHVAHGRLGDEIARYERALSVLQSQPVVTAPVSAPDDRPLNIVITETAAAFQLTIRRLEPDGARIRVVLDEAPFDAVVLWLEAAQRDQGLRVTELEMTRRPAPASLMLPSHLKGDPMTSQRLRQNLPYPSPARMASSWNTPTQARSVRCAPARR